MVSTKRMNAVVELRDAAMQLLKERGQEEILQGVARMLVTVGDIEIAAWSPNIDVTGLDIWAPNKVLNIWTNGAGEIRIVSFSPRAVGNQAARSFRARPGVEAAAIKQSRCRDLNRLDRSEHQRIVLAECLCQS